MSLSQYPPTLLLNARQNCRVPIDQILYLKGDINYTHLYFKFRKSIIMPHSLKRFEADLLPFGFLRIHRSYLVNSHFVKSANLSDSTVTLMDETVLQIARRRIKQVRLLRFP